MVLAPDEDDPLVAAAELLDEVAHVRGEIGGGLALVRAEDDAVLVVAESGRSEGDGAAILVDVSGFTQLLDRPSDPAVVVERALRAPDIEMAAEAFQARFDAGPNLLGGPAACGPGRVLAGVGRFLEDRRRQLACHLVNVGAVVAVLGDVVAVADGDDARPEIPHLRPEIVEVVLALH